MSFAMSAPSSSPPPYSLTPPETHATVPTKRASSSPHLRVFTRARPPSSASISRPPYTNGYSRSCSRVDSSDDSEDSGAETDDGVMFTSVHPSFADTLRQRILGKGKGRACDSPCIRPITTAPGVLGAGETETEGEDSPRNLPTARITPSSLSYLALPAAAAAVIPFLFEFSRLLSIVPAMFGTLWNLYHVFHPPDDSIRWRVEFFISALWSILTGWQCLQLTTGLLKRWRVYYSPLPTLIRLLALQAICWPATHFTLTLLGHEARPLVCWAAIGTTTCCSRSIQLWVTSNIVAGPLGPGEHEEWMKMGRRRKWDWGAVGAKCALPAGVVYCLMAWAIVLLHEWERC